MGTEYPDEVDELLLPWLRRHTKAQIAERATRRRCPWPPCGRWPEALEDPQMNHRRFYVISEEQVRVPGFPLTANASPRESCGGRARGHNGSRPQLLRARPVARHGARRPRRRRHLPRDAARESRDGSRSSMTTPSSAGSGTSATSERHRGPQSRRGPARVQAAR